MSTQATPNGCSVCGLPERGHPMCFDAATGLHYWTEPTPAQRLDRMRARRVPAQVDEATIRADERERMACDAEERGDIGKADGPEAWVWLRSPGAPDVNPRKYRMAQVDEAATGGERS